VAIVVIDASVVIALLDAGDPHHVAAMAAVEQARRDALVLPASAYAEVLVDPWRRGVDAVGVIRKFVTDLGIRVEPITPDIAERAARLRAQHRGLRLPDALVLATADVVDGVALTCDRAWRRVGRRVRLV